MQNRFIWKSQIVQPPPALKPGGAVSSLGAKATATLIDTAPMAQWVMDVRAGLPSNLRRSGNVAIAEIDIPRIPSRWLRTAKSLMPVKGLLALEVEILWLNLYPTRPEIWFIGE